jgi:hypothetical protein
VASALRGHLLGGKLDPVKLDKAVAEFAAFHIERHQMTSLLGRMLDLRDSLTVHDAAYLVLTRALQATGGVPVLPGRDLAVLGAWAVAALLASLRLFRWEPQPPRTRHPARAAEGA